MDDRQYTLAKPAEEAGRSKQVSDHPLAAIKPPRIGAASGNGFLPGIAPAAARGAEKTSISLQVQNHGKFCALSAVDYRISAGERESLHPYSCKETNSSASRQV